MTTISMNVKRFARQFQYSVIALALMSTYSSRAAAQEGHSHPAAQEETELTQKQRDSANALVQVVRAATERFKDVAIAESEGYALQFGCVSGDDFGAMGLHYVNGALVKSGILDPNKPQIVIYEATPDGGRKLIGADYLVIADQWNSTHSGPPEMMGQFFHLFTSPNRFGLPAFYTLHVWAWKNNPKGAFVNWHPNVSCASYSAQNQ